MMKQWTEITESGATRWDCENISITKTKAGDYRVFDNSTNNTLKLCATLSHARAFGKRRLAPMFKLPPQKWWANATLIDSKPVPGSEFLSVVICRVENSGLPVEFATWIYNHEFRGCVQGHYFDNLVDAVKDYDGRR